jgi:hypothetical protein
MAVTDVFRVALRDYCAWFGAAYRWLQGELIAKLLQFFK